MPGVGVKEKSQEELIDIRIRQKQIEADRFRVVTREGVDRLGLMSTNEKFLVILFKDSSGGITLMNWGVNVNFDSSQRVTSFELINRNPPMMLGTSINVRQLEASIMNVVENEKVQEKLKNLREREEPEKVWERVGIEVFREKEGQYRTNTGVEVSCFVSREKELILAMAKDGQSVKFVKMGEAVDDIGSWQVAYYRVTDRNVAHGKPVYVEELKETLRALLQMKEFREDVAGLEFK